MAEKENLPAAPATPPNALASSPNPIVNSSLLDLSDGVDEVPNASSDEENEPEAKDEKGEGEGQEKQKAVDNEPDTRKPAAPKPLADKGLTDEEKEFKAGFARAEGLLKGKNALKFTTEIDGPTAKGTVDFLFSLDREAVTWSVTKTLKELNQLSDKLKKDASIRGFQTSIPPLPDKKSRPKKGTDPLTIRAQRTMVAAFAKKCMGHGVLLSHHLVQTAFQIPPQIRARIDTFQRLYQTPLLSSYLYKEGGKVKSWRRRFCILYPDFTLRYYEEKNEATGGGKGFKGLLDIHQLTKIQYYQVARSANNFTFGFVLPHREFKFETDSHIVQKIWMEGVSTLIDGPLAKYAPDCKDANGEMMGRLNTLRSVKASSTKPSKSRMTSKDRIDTARMTKVKFQARLAELREMQDRVRETNAAEQDQQRAQQQKLEDEFSDLQPLLAKAQKNSEEAMDLLKTLRAELRENETNEKAKLEGAEAMLKEVRRKYGLRLPDDSRDIMKIQQQRQQTARARRITIERSAPAALSGEMLMYFKGVPSRKITVWYLLIDGSAYLEWQDNSKTDSATRMKIAGVTDMVNGVGEDEASRFFSVKSAKKSKVIGFLASDTSTRNSWVRSIRMALGEDADDAKDDGDESP